MSKVIHLPNHAWGSTASDEVFDASVDLATDSGDELAELHAHNLSPCYSAQCVAMGAFDYLIDTVGYEKACEAFEELAGWFEEQRKR